MRTELPFIWFFSDCVMNVLAGVVPINKAKMEKFETQLRQLSNKTFSSESKSQRLQTVKGHF